MVKILVVEDDDLITEFLKRSLQIDNHKVDFASDGLDGYNMALKNRYGVIILDVMLPMKNGLDVCRDLRENSINTPIIFLSARNSESARVQGLDAGADDYLVKPFSYKELNARIRAVNRRPSPNLQSKITVGNLVLDSNRHEVHSSGELINLRPKEFELLEYMMRRPRQLIPKQELLKEVWGVVPTNASNRLEVCMRNLRQKIDIVNLNNDSYIQTIRNKGYRFIPKD